MNASATTDLAINPDDVSWVCSSVTTRNIILVEEALNIIAFPNPFKNQFSIQFGETYQQTTIEVYTSSGLKISNSTYADTDLINIDLKNQFAGI